MGPGHFVLAHPPRLEPRVELGVERLDVGAHASRVGIEGAPQAGQRRAQPAAGFAHHASSVVAATTVGAVGCSISTLSAGTPDCRSSFDVPAGRSKTATISTSYATVA